MPPKRSWCSGRGTRARSSSHSSAAPLTLATQRFVRPHGAALTIAPSLTASSTLRSPTSRRSVAFQRRAAIRNSPSRFACSITCCQGMSRIADGPLPHRANVPVASDRTPPIDDPRLCNLRGLSPRRGGNPAWHVTSLANLLGFSFGRGPLLLLRVSLLLAIGLQRPARAELILERTLAAPSPMSGAQ